MLAVVAGCGGGGEKSAATTTAATTVVTTTGTSDTPTVTTHGRFHYPQAYITNFMQTCTKNRKRAYCACTLDKLSNNVSNKDLAGIAASGGKVPPRVQRLIKQAANACRDKF
jgi:hypothetical protein